MKKQRLRTVVVLFAAFLGIVASVTACTSEDPAPRRSFATEAMLMNAELFPPGWSDRPIIPTADSHGAVEHPSRDMNGWGTVVHEIYRYEYVRAAQREYRRQLDVFYTSPQYLGTWEPSPELTRRLSFADEAYVACARYIAPQTANAERCGMLARYDEFVVRFSAQVAPSAVPVLDEEALAELLAKLDDRFESAMTSETSAR